MKKIILLSISILLASSSFAQLFSKEDIKATRDFDVENFSGISIGNATDLTLVKADEFALTIEVSEEYIDYISIKYTSSGVMSIGYDKLPLKLRNSKKSHMKATISMPYINSMDISGATTVTSNDSFTTVGGMQKFNISCSGASTINKFKITAPEAVVTVSGASKVELDGKFGELDAEVSGASKLVLSGEAGEFELECGGASSTNAESLEAEDVELEVSGASRADVFVTKRLEVEVTGASTCTYTTAGQIQLDVKKIAGASSFKRKEASK